MWVTIAGFKGGIMGDGGFSDVDLIQNICANELITIRKSNKILVKTLPVKTHCPQ